MKYKFPCMGCPDRWVGCHASCDKYLMYKNKVVEENSIASQKRLHESVMHRIAIDRGVRARKASNLTSY